MKCSNCHAESPYDACPNLNCARLVHCGREREAAEAYATKVQAALKVFGASYSMFDATTPPQDRRIGQRRVRNGEMSEYMSRTLVGDRRTDKVAVVSIPGNSAERSLKNQPCAAAPYNAAGQEGQVCNGDSGLTGSAPVPAAPDSTLPRDCKHGQLARSCNVCELEQRVAEQEAEILQIHKDVQIKLRDMSRELSELRHKKARDHDQRVIAQARAKEEHLGRKTAERGLRGLQQRVKEQDVELVRIKETLGECELCDRDLITLNPDGSSNNCICLACWNGLVTRAEKAERELRIAAGMISTMPQFEDKHPEVALQFIKDAALKGDGK